MSMLALCMVVKDEIGRLQACLEPLLSHVDDVVIVDTGSTDGTPELLEQKFGITPLHGRLESSRCLCKSDLRNYAYSLCKADWILSIDADERVHPDSVKLILENIQSRNAPAGFFGKWVNHLQGERDFEDYKLFLFRRGLRKRGLVHENVQLDIREAGHTADWLHGFEVHHYPDPRKHEFKTHLYRKRLECALMQQPEWLRYNWFLGYMHYQAGEWVEACTNFDKVISAQPVLFPVECLNSFMLRIEIAARQKLPNLVEDLLENARSYHQRMADDFEVKVNFRIQPWFEMAERLSQLGQLDGIRAYRFAR
jgi:glycosyltransferase involved in cell wall biosynthesis